MKLSKKTAKNVKSSEKAVEAVKNMVKIIKSNKCNILWLAYQQGKIFEKFKINEVLKKYLYSILKVVTESFYYFE